MKLEEVQAQLQADKEAREAEAAEEAKKEESRLIGKLAEIGVLAVDGWTIVSNYRFHPYISVSHPQLKQALHVYMDYEYDYPYRMVIVQEEPDRMSEPVSGIIALVNLMSREIFKPKPTEPKLRCPVLSDYVASEGWCDCLTERCAWWNAHFHKCARAVLPSSGNP